MRSFAETQKGKKIKGVTPQNQFVPEPKKAEPK